MGITRFEDIKGWQLARRLSLEIFEHGKTGSFRRDFGLRDQIGRAAGSAMDNIAEGFDAGGRKEFIRFLQYAQRSCTEVQSQLYRALDRQHITPQQFNDLYAMASETHACIGGFIKYLKSKVAH